jgi:hypothetical protein
MASTARNAGASYQVWGYWYAMLFLVGSLALVLGLLGMAFSATTVVERVLSLGMIAIIVFSLYVGGMAWVSSVAGDTKGVAEAERSLPRWVMPGLPMP